LNLSVNHPEFSKDLDKITSDTTVSKLYVKRRSFGQRNLNRVAFFHSKNRKTDLLRNSNGAHDGDTDRWIQFATGPTDVNGLQKTLLDYTRKSSPGTYPGLTPPEIPWPIVEEFLALSRPKHEFIDPNNIRHGFIDMNFALPLLTGPAAISFTTDGRYCFLKYKRGESPNASLRLVKLDSEQSYLPIEIQITSENGRTAADVSISYHRLVTAGRADIIIPESIKMANYFTAEGKHSKLLEEELSMKRCEIIPDDGRSPLQAPLDYFPQLSEDDLRLLGLANEEADHR
jgi:hypothetical protein